MLVREVLSCRTPRGEKEDHLKFVQSATGRVLIAGLGLGMVTNAVLLKGEVEWVTVVEIDPDVVSLVAPHIQSPRLEVVRADIYTWRPREGERFDCAWFDVWETICRDNLRNMRKLERKFKPFCGSMGFWSRDRFERGRR